MADFIERSTKFLTRSDTRYLIDDEHGDGTVYLPEGREHNDRYIATVFVDQETKLRMQREAFSEENPEAIMQLVETDNRDSIIQVPSLDEARNLNRLGVKSAAKVDKTVYSVSLHPDHFKYALLLRKDGKFFFSDMIVEVSDQMYVTKLRARSRLSSME